MRDLSLEEKIAQMFIIEIHGKDISDDTIDLIQKYKVGGVILYRRNYDSYEQMVELVNKLKKVNSKNDIPLFVSIDQEGGRVNRMPFEINNIRNASKVAATKDIDIVRRSANITSRMLSSFGISLNYAPVLDIRRFEDENHAIGNRCFGYNKEDVSLYGIEFMKEMQSNGVLPAIKHFPGHGSTIKDSHFTLPVVKKRKRRIRK